MKKLLLLALAASLPAHSADKLSLMLDWFINPDHAAIIVAEQKGFFAEAQLKVEIIEPTDPAIAPKMVAAKNVDLAVDYQPRLYLHAQEGLPISRVSTLIGNPLNTIIVKANSDIKQIADLKGKKIGYSIAGIDEALLTPILATAHLTLKDVELINVNFSLSPSVMTGKVDAIIGGFRNFELYEMKRHGEEGRAFLLEEHGVPHYDELIIIAHHDQRHDPRLVRFNQALEKATQYINANPEAAWQSYISYKAELDDDINRNAWQATLPYLATKPAVLDKARYQRYGEFMQSIGLIKEVPEVDSIAVEP